MKLIKNIYLMFVLKQNLIQIKDTKIQNELRNLIKIEYKLRYYIINTDSQIVIGLKFMI